MSKNWADQAMAVVRAAKAWKHARHNADGDCRSHGYCRDGMCPNLAAERALFAEVEKLETLG